MNIKNLLLQAKFIGKEKGKQYFSDEPATYKITLEVPQNVEDHYDEVMELIDDEQVGNYLISTHELEVYGEKLTGDDLIGAKEVIQDTLEIENNIITFETLGTDEVEDEEED